MVIPPIDVNVLATVIAAVFGGAGLKIIEKLLNRETETTKQATVIRDELRTQVHGLKNDVMELKHENEDLNAELIVWQEKYWELKARKIKIEAQLALLNNKLEQHEITDETEIPPSTDDVQ